MANINLLLLKLSVILLVYAYVAESQQCSYNERLSSSSTCLKIIYQPDNFKTILEANEACVSRGFHLAKASDSRDTTLMQRLLEGVRAMTGRKEEFAFLGGSDITHEGEFYWTDGSPVPNLWGQREPNDYALYGGEDCVTADSKGTLNDVPCCFERPSGTVVSSVICEYDPIHPDVHPSDSVFYEKCITVTSVNSQTSTSSVLQLGTYSVQTSTPFEILVTPTTGAAAATAPAATESSSSSVYIISVGSGTPKSSSDLISSATDDVTSRFSTITPFLISSTGLRMSPISETEGALTDTSSTHSQKISSTVSEITSTELQYSSSMAPLVVRTSIGENTTNAVITTVSHLTGSNSTIKPLTPRFCIGVDKTGTRTPFEIDLYRVKRNETQNYRRKLSCATDNRTSSYIICIIWWILTACPYLFILMDRRRNKNTRQSGKVHPKKLQTVQN